EILNELQECGIEYLTCLYGRLIFRSHHSNIAQVVAVVMRVGRDDLQIDTILAGSNTNEIPPRCLSHERSVRSVTESPLTVVQHDILTCGIYAIFRFWHAQKE